MMRRRHAAARGFTLLEILVAVAVFAVVAVLAYGGLDHMLQLRDRDRHSADRLRALQQAMLIVSRDVGQVAQRSIRDTADAERQPAMVGATQDIPPLAFTRGGWSNPLGESRSTLQRVAYTVDGDKLVRLYWPDLDRVREHDPLRETLLKGVTAIQVRFVDENGQWQDQWPPLNQSPQAYLDKLPRIVEVTLQLKDYGTIQRLIELPE